VQETAHFSSARVTFYTRSFRLLVVGSFDRLIIASTPRELCGSSASAPLMRRKTRNGETVKPEFFSLFFQALTRHGIYAIFSTY
jgi:hypothetical protein